MQQFATRLRSAAKDCEYGNDVENQMRDAVLNKCESLYVKRKLLEEGQGLTLARTLQIAQQCESVESQMAAMTLKNDESQSEQINRVARDSTSGERQPARGDATDVVKRDISRVILNAQPKGNRVATAGERTILKMCVVLRRGASTS